MANICRRLFNRRFVLAFAASGAVLVAIVTAAAQTAAQQHFNTPEEAIAALASAAKGHDRTALERILGPRAKDLVTADELQDANALDAFAGLVAEKIAVERESDTRVTFALGESEWPFPVPAVSETGGWRFDSDAGFDELVSRRIGSNERSAIFLCRAYALAQWEYFTTGDWDGDGVAEYAQRLRSSNGARDGLYWPTVGEAPPSPLGPIVARVEEAGYRSRTGGDPRVTVPVFGYRFKIVMRQGPSAPGGRHGYVINGNMIAGFALVAYPAEWGKSGVMTFIVNQQGRVYEKDLGPNTKLLAEAMETYDPDASWSVSGE